jgi:hypothetical protein
MASPRRFAKVSLAVSAAVTLALTLAACDAGGTTLSLAAAAQSPAAASAPVQLQAGAPKTPPAQICGSRRALTGPAAKPARAIRVPAGNDANVNFSSANTTYWFAPGVHTLGLGQFQNITPANGDTYVGAPGAILDGQHSNNSAFDGGATHVVIEYLTIRNLGRRPAGRRG